MYIHVAFCRRKCIYCDFYSVGDRRADWHGYVDALIAELNWRKTELPNPLHTIYIGGGTPSLMPVNEFQRLCEALKPYMPSVEEFTIEVNPDDVTQERLEAWKKGGVNRLSMGVQTFDNDLLGAIRRRHTAEAAETAYRLARETFGNVSVDLIFGIPGQTMEMWQNDIRKVLVLRPKHISAYSMMYEPGTALTLLRDRGDVKETPEDLSEAMLLTLIAELRAAGYEHYEISNFALPGFRSLHNSSYWKGTAYLGLGPSAHSYDGNRCRSANKADVQRYLAVWKGVGAPEDIIEREYLSDEELREEYVMTRLRTCEGIDLEDFRNRFGNVQYSRLMCKAQPMIADGQLISDSQRLHISEDAILVSDSIILALA